MWQRVQPQGPVVLPVNGLRRVVERRGVAERQESSQQRPAFPGGDRVADGPACMSGAPPVPNLGMASRTPPPPAPPPPRFLTCTSRGTGQRWLCWATLATACWKGVLPGTGGTTVVPRSRHCRFERSTTSSQLPCLSLRAGVVMGMRERHEMPCSS